MGPELGKRQAGLGFPKSKLHRNIALGSSFFSSFKAKLFFFQLKVLIKTEKRRD